LLLRRQDKLLLVVSYFIFAYHYLLSLLVLGLVQEFGSAWGLLELVVTQGCVGTILVELVARKGKYRILTAADILMN
jgi:hypothetical protein